MKTQVVDLSAGKFIGVKPQGKLSDLIDFAKSRGQKLNYPTPEAVLEKENLIRFNDKETLAFYDRDGEMMFTRTGEPDNVKFDLTPAEEKLLNLSTMTHNHPASLFSDKTGWQWKGVSFSIDDIRTAITLNLAEIRAVGNEFRYSMRPGKNGWSNKFKTEIEAEYSLTKKKIESELVLKIAKREIDFDYFNGVLHHLIWEALAEKYNLRYNRIAN